MDKGMKFIVLYCRTQSCNRKVLLFLVSIAASHASSNTAKQLSYIEHWYGGMKGTIPVHGPVYAWKAHLLFDGQVDSLEIWDASIIQNKTRDNGGTEFVLESKSWEADIIQGQIMTVQFVCRTHGATPPRGFYYVIPYTVIDYTEYWNGGMKGAFIVQADKPVYGWEARFLFDGHVNSLEIWDAIIENKTSRMNGGTEFILKSTPGSANINQGQNMTVIFVCSTSSATPPQGYYYVISHGRDEGRTYTAAPTSTTILFSSITTPSSPITTQSSSGDANPILWILIPILIIVLVVCVALVAGLILYKRYKQRQSKDFANQNNREQVEIKQTRSDPAHSDINVSAKSGPYEGLENPYDYIPNDYHTVDAGYLNFNEVAKDNDGYIQPVKTDTDTEHAAAEIKIDEALPMACFGSTNARACGSYQDSGYTTYICKTGERAEVVV